MPIIHVREGHEKNVAEKVVELISDEQDEGNKVSEEIEEVTRIGKYHENKHRPLKIRMKSQVPAEELISRSWKLPEVGTATRFFKPLSLLPLPWLAETATATSATFSKYRERYPLLRYR